MKPMAPGSTFYHISFRSILFCNLYFSIYTTKIPKIFILLSLSDLTFASGREGIDNPFIALVARFLFVCVGTRDLRVTSYWIDTLVLKNWGKYLRYFAASPFPLQGKTNACSRGSKNDFWRRCRGGVHQVKSRYDLPTTSHFWRRCRGDLRQVKTYQIPITTLILRITLFAICLSFSSPPLHPCCFIRPLFPSASFFACFLCPVCHHG